MFQGCHIFRKRAIVKLMLKAYKCKNFYITSKSAWNPTTTRTSISHADAVRKCEHLYAPTQTLLAENLSKSSSAKQTGTFCRLCATFLFFNILLGMGMYFVLRPIAYVLGDIRQLCGPDFAQFTTYPTFLKVS